MTEYEKRLLASHAKILRALMAIAISLGVLIGIVLAGFIMLLR